MYFAEASEYSFFLKYPLPIGKADSLASVPYVSMTTVTSAMVIDVSAMLVAKTTLRFPDGGGANMSF